MGLFGGKRSEATTGRTDEAAPKPPGKEGFGMAMLRRDDGPTTGELNAVLGKGSSFEGKLAFEGTVRIEGKFSGEIHTSDVLVIGEGAKVEAEITAGTVVITGGDVQGNIRAKVAVELDKGARVRGTIETPVLRVEKGVVFNGSCKMGAELEKSSISEKSDDKKK